MRKVLPIVGRNRLGKPAIDLWTLPVCRQAGVTSSGLSGAIASGFAGCWVGAVSRPPGGAWLADRLVRPGGAPQKVVEALAHLVEGDGRTEPPESEDKLRCLRPSQPKSCLKTCSSTGRSRPGASLSLSGPNRRRSRS